LLFSVRFSLSCPCNPKKLLTLVLFALYPFPALLSRSFLSLFPPCPNPPKFQGVLRVVCGGILGYFLVILAWCFFSLVLVIFQVCFWAFFCSYFLFLVGFFLRGFFGRFFGLKIHF
jgi:hypothetical protein